MRIGDLLIAMSCACAAAAAQDAARTTWDGVYTGAQAQRGATAYAESCASCHAVDLTGLDAAPALTGPEFSAGWNDQTLDDLFERIRTTMPADGPGSLSRQQYTDIVAFVLSKNGFPTGQTELRSENGALKQIRFTAQKK